MRTSALDDRGNSDARQLITRRRAGSRVSPIGWKMRVHYAQSVRSSVQGPAEMCVPVVAVALKPRIRWWATQTCCLLVAPGIVAVFGHNGESVK
jgi:hypothetical protein